MALVYSLLATFVVSLISLVGIITIGIKSKFFDKIVLLLVGFAAGSLIGTAFLHLLPEAAEKLSSENVFFFTVLGFTLFFIMERYFHWRHCHKGVCDVHAFTYLNLIGDGVHNFTDGLVIAAAFVTDMRIGIVTTLAVIFHEIPQEIGDFGILVYGGLSKKRALFFNFVCASTAVFGALLGYFLSNIIVNFSIYLLPFVAGGFIYIASSDLIPELHRDPDVKRANFSLLAFIFGLIFTFFAKFIH